ncbi:MAG: hypothetical protein VZS44_00370 [Bacilli bacterium]|nr:hypothetical protein [Bacilli bacterium]
MDKNKENDDKTLIKTLEDVQKEFPDLILPNMGIIDNEKDVEINGKDYLKNKDAKEE